MARLVSNAAKGYRALATGARKITDGTGSDGGGKAFNEIAVKRDPPVDVTQPFVLNVCKGWKVATRL
jgi:hypothetical protein